MGGRCVGVVMGAVLTIGLVGCANTAPPPEARPLPTGSVAFGGAQYRAAAQSFYQRLLVDAYAAHADAAAPWHADGKALVAAWVAHAVDRSAYRPGAALDAAIRPLLGQRIADPAVCLLLGLRLQERDHLAAGRWLKHAVDGLSGSRYSPQVMCLAPAALLKEVGRGRAGDATVSRLDLVRLRDQLVLRAVQEPLTRPVEKRLLVQVLNEASDGGAGPPGDLWLAVAKTRGCDRWLRHYYRGLSELEQAWQAGGQGPADRRKGDADPEYARHLRCARRALEAAWHEHPDLPEAPTAMIEVARAGYAGPRATARTWFDRAVAGQYDYAPAYQQLTQALLPRSGGNIDMVLSLSRECVATARFETAVPRCGVRALDLAATDGRDPSVWRRAPVVSDLETLLKAQLAACAGDRSLWRHAEVQRDLGILLRGLVTGHQGQADAGGWLALEAVVTCRRGQYDEALRQLQQLGAKPELTLAATWLQSEPEALLGEVRALGGKRALARRAAEEADLAGDRAAALAGFQAALAAAEAVGENAAVVRWLRVRVDELQIETATNA